MMLHRIMVWLCLSAAMIGAENQKIAFDGLDELSRGSPDNDGLVGQVIALSLDNFEKKSSDKLNWPKYAEWLLEHDLYGGEEYAEWERSRIKDALSSSLRHSLRETALELEAFHNGLNWAEGLATAVWGETLEEEVDPVSLSYHRSNRSWWKVKLPKQAKFGIRPFRTSPYTFMTFEVGGQGIAKFHLRYYYRDYSAHYFEIGSSHSITRTWRLNTGFAYGNESNNEWGCEKFVVRLEKSMGRVGNKESVFFVGFRLNRDLTSTLIGFGRDW